jgi:predicted esterase
MNAILTLNIIDGPLIWVLFLLSAAIAICLLIRPVRLKWVLTALIGILGGGVIALGAVLIVNASGAFGGPLPAQAELWIMATFAAVGLAVVSLWNSRWWRKIVAIVGIIVFGLTGTLAVNAYYGLNKTVAAFMGITVDNPQPLPTVDPSKTPTANPNEPLYQSWKPPAGMASVGQQSTQVIPNTISGFQARPAGIYLPPAALVPNAPALPLVVLMMGQPGNPDTSYIADVLDSYAAQNNGLAPIVVVADQIGSPDQDPVCLDSAKYGNAETYITQDVVNWARKNLNVLQDPAHWTVAGYSNGGACAFKYGAEHPEIWGNVLDISGELYAGSENPATVQAQLFGGDAAAFDASKPASILASGAHTYPDTWGIFTSGSNDPVYVDEAQKASDAATAAGWHVTNYVIPGAGHVVDALNGGLQKGFEILYPRLGLSK